MKTNAYITFAILVGIGLIAPSQAFAERSGMIGLSLGGGTQVETDASDDDSVLSASVQANVDANAEASYEVEDDTSSTTETEDEDTRGSAGIGSTISVEAKTLRTMNEEDKSAFLASVKTAAQVRSDSDFQVFAKGALLRDDNLEAVSSDDNTVSVTYSMPAKLFGLFDIRIPVTAQVRVSGESGSTATSTVAVHFPWYLRFITNIPETVSESELQAAVNAQVTSGVSGHTQLDAQVQAQTLQAIVDVLRVRHDMTIDAAAGIE